MLTYTARMDPIPNHIELDIGCMDASEGSQNKGNSVKTVLEIARQAAAVNDPREFLRKAAEILQESDDYSLVQIWALAPDRDRLVLSDRSFNALRDLFVSRTIPALMEECRRGGATSEMETPAEQKAVSASTVQRVITPLYLHGYIFGLLSIEDDRQSAFSAESRDTMNGAASIINATFDMFKAIEEARQSNEYLRSILNSAADMAILATDQLGYITTISSGSEAIFQLPLQSILNRDIVTIFTDERFQQDLIIAINRRDGHSVTLKNNRLRQTTKNGTLYLDVSFQKLCCSESSETGFLCFAKDVTGETLCQQKIEAAARIDNITGLFNHQHMMSALAYEIERCRLFNRSFSLCLLKLNNIKINNDSHGSSNGDETIKAVASLMRTLTRTNVDACCRYGDDEFAIIMPETSACEATRMSELILKQLRDFFDGAVTARIGIAEYSPSLKAMNIIDKAVHTMH